MMSTNDETSRRCLKGRHNKWNDRAVLFDKLTQSRRCLKGIGTTSGMPGLFWLIS